MNILGLVDIPVWVLLLTVITVLYYFYITANYGVFKKMGVDGPKPFAPLGNLFTITRKGIIAAEGEWTKKYGRVYGIYEGRHPLLMVGDADMLKDITVKEFNNFTNRRDFGLRHYSPEPGSKFLTVQVDDDWRHNRNTQTPAFSSGKLKRMTGMITSAAESMVGALKPHSDKRQPVDIKQFTSAYTMDVIAATAFGLQVDAQNAPNGPVLRNAKKFFEFSLFNPLFLCAFICPFVLPLVGFFKFTAVPMEAVRFFEAIVQQALKERRQNPGKFTDFLQLMLTAENEAQSSHSTPSHDEPESTPDGHWVDKRKGEGLTDGEILANAITFFTAGFDTTATTMAHALHHLVKNVDCQEKLIAEIDQHFPPGTCPGYENVNDLRYLEMVISETLRINPPIARMDRECKNDCVVAGIHIPKGMGVSLPIYNMHHDPGYWPDPEKFDPERFEPEKRQQHHPLQWIPFGYGPRNCIGMRLAQLEMKIAMVRLFQEYRFEANEKTVPLRFGETVILTNAKDGVWMTPINRK